MPDTPEVARVVFAVGAHHERAIGGIVRWNRHNDSVRRPSPDQIPLGLSLHDDRGREEPRLPRPALPDRLAVARPTDGDAPFDDERYFFEPWWPGIRAQAFVEKGTVRLRAEALTDPTAAFPELAELPALVKGDGVVLDVVLLVLDATTRPNPTFLGRRLDAPTRAGARPLGHAAAVATDLLYRDGHPFTDRTFGERHAELAALLAPSPWCLPGRGFIGDGAAVASALGEMGFRGMSARRLDAPAKAGPAGDAWFRVPVTPREPELPPFLAIFSKLPL